MIVSKNLDIYQRKAVYTEDNNVLIVAPPGSGKTTVTINRVAYLINDKGVNPDNIIVITFTKAAASNMKERYMKLINKKSPFFGTFHALFYKILSRYSRNINIINSSTTYKLIKGVLVSYLDSVNDEKVREVINDISLFKNGSENIESYNSKIDKGIFKECFSTYETYKEKNCLMDFDDLQLRARKLFIERPEILAGYRELFKYILVDEFQDCDRLQIELLQMLGYNNSIFAVGDEDQCIYGFRGSRPDCMVDFGIYFDNGKKIFLCMNYRSTENIVSLSKKLIEKNKNRNSKEIKENKKEKGNINFKSVENEKEQSVKIVEIIRKLIEEGTYEYKDIAVLYRTNMESRSIIDSFLGEDIPFKLLDKEYDFFDHFVCKDMLAYLKLSIDITDKESFLRIINKPFRYISKVNIEKVRRSAIRDNCFDMLKDIDDIPIFQLKSIDKLEKDICRLNRMHLRDAIKFIIKDLGYNDYINEYSQRLKMDNIELKDVLEEFKEAAEDFNSITSFLVHVDVIKEELKKKSSDEKGVVLSTIHGVKGMEFKNVFIINCDEGVIPHINSIPENMEEERRLFYVAITRAIDNLSIYSTKRLKGKGKEISRFIKECGIDYKEKAYYESGFVNPYEIGQLVNHKVYGSGKISDKDGNYINIVFNNGIERKFDAFVLKNSGLLVKN